MPNKSGREVDMKEIRGYYDGNTVQLLEPAPQTKQDVIVTFIEDDSAFDDLPVGILSKYADPARRGLEEGAFERAMVEKHGNG
jgi:hypothetical protein